MGECSSFGENLMNEVKVKFSDLLLEVILLLFLMMTFAAFLANILVGSFSICFLRDTIIVIIAVVLMVILHEVTHIITLYLLGYRKIEIGAKISKSTFCIYIKSPGKRHEVILF